MIELTFENKSLNITLNDSSLSQVANNLSLAGEKIRSLAEHGPELVSITAKPSLQMDLDTRDSIVGLISPDTNPNDIPPWILPYVRFLDTQNLRSDVYAKLAPNINPDDIPPNILPYIKMFDDVFMNHEKTQLENSIGKLLLSGNLEFY